MENGTAQPGISVAERLRRNRKITSTTIAMVSISVNSTSRMEPRMDCDASKAMERWIGGRNFLAELGQQALDIVHHLHGIGAGLPLDRQDDGALVVVPGDDLVVIDAVDDVAEFFQPHRRCRCARSR